MYSTFASFRMYYAKTPRNNLKITLYNFKIHLKIGYKTNFIDVFTSKVVFYTQLLEIV